MIDNPQKNSASSSRQELELENNHKTENMGQECMLT